METDFETMHTQSIQKYTYNTHPTHSDTLVCGRILLNGKPTRIYYESVFTRSCMYCGG